MKLNSKGVLLMKKYDVILIGTGSANIIADAAITQGLSVAIVERAVLAVPA